MHSFEQSLSLPIPREELFAWHRRPGAFERLGPSWQRLEIISHEGGTIENGARLHFRAYEGPLWINWVARHEGFEAGRRFIDVAERSPFAAWTHVHAFEDEGRGARLEDRVRYRLPFDALTWVVARRQVEGMLERMFRQRHVRTANDLRHHWLVRGRGPKRMAMFGARGPICAQLGAFWTTGGNTLAAAGPLDALVELDPGLLGERNPKVEPAPRDTAPPEVFVRVMPATASSTPSSAERAAEDAGARVVRLRTGVVSCLANPLVRGRRTTLDAHVQQHGALDLDDVLALIHHLIYTPSLAGEVDARFGHVPASFELDFPTLASSLAHQRGRADPGAVEQARARWIDLEEGAESKLTA